MDKVKEAAQDLAKRGGEPKPVKFKVGEIFKLRGVACYVRKITKKDIILRPCKFKEPAKGDEHENKN